MLPGENFEYPGRFVKRSEIANYILGAVALRSHCRFAVAGVRPYLLGELLSQYLAREE